MQPSSAVKLVSRIFPTLLLAAAILPTPAQAQTFTVLHTFHGQDGSGPLGVLILDSEGNIYGTTGGGGSGTGCPIFSSFGCGTAFILNKAGKEVALYSFDGADGAGPDGGLLRDAKGNLYGTTQYGGATSTCPDGQEGCGVAYRLARTGKETEYKFQGEQDGFNPTGPLAEDSTGNFYGTTRFGGPNGLGTVFKINASGKKTVLYSFTGFTDGCDPTAGVILDSMGNLYGIANDGGAGLCDSGFGTVFKLSGSGEFSVIHTFGGGDGAYPDSVLLFDKQGNLYGNTSGGGDASECFSDTGCGTVFELSPQQDGSWSETVLYSFCSLSDCTDGEEPGGGPLVRDSFGNLYGTTFFGGQSGNGVAFKLDSGGNETVWHSFTGGTDGANPAAGLAMDSSGNFYGNTQIGGTTCFTRYTCGVVFKITP